LSRVGIESDWTYPPLRGFVNEQVSAADISAIVWTWSGFDNHHFQYQSGFLTKEAWEAQLRAQQALYWNCEFRFVYEWTKGRMRASVIELVGSWDDPCADENL
jgi:hypothetical protein